MSTQAEQPPRGPGQRVSPAVRWVGPCQQVLRTRSVGPCQQVLPPDRSDPAASSPPITFVPARPGAADRRRRRRGVPGRLRLALLALLALAEGRAVPASTLIDPSGPRTRRRPVSPHSSHISRLRAHLGPAAGRLRRYEGAYALATPGQLNVGPRPSAGGEVADLVDSDPRRAAELGAEALRTVAGTALNEFSDMPALAAAPVGLECAAAPRRRPAAGGDRPRDPWCLARAATAAAAGPLRERTVILHVRALAAEDRAAEALEVAARFRGRLADETGLDPGPALRAPSDVAAGSLAPPPITAARRVARPVTPSSVGSTIAPSCCSCSTSTVPRGLVVGPGGIVSAAVTRGVGGHLRSRRQSGCRPTGSGGRCRSLGHCGRRRWPGGGRGRRARPGEPRARRPLDSSTPQPRCFDRRRGLSPGRAQAAAAAGQLRASHRPVPRSGDRHRRRPPRRPPPCHVAGVAARAGASTSCGCCRCRCQGTQPTPDLRSPAECPRIRGARAAPRRGFPLTFYDSPLWLTSVRFGSSTTCAPRSRFRRRTGRGDAPCRRFGPD